MTVAQTRQRRVAPFVATIVGVVLGALLIVLVTADPNPSDNAESPLLGNPAPAVVSTTLEDETFELARRKGSWVIFNFFNSTCVPCVNEHPDLVAFAEAEAKSANPAELYNIYQLEGVATKRGGLTYHKRQLLAARKTVGRCERD